MSSAYVVLAPLSEVRLGYFAYLLKSRRYIEALQSTSNLVRDGQALRFENFAQVDLPSVPPPEQEAIAAFLDRETARIDALVAKKERLIALLQEQRTALITRAVTKGLDPTVPMKDSGVEWLGNVPADAAAWIHGVLTPEAQAPRASKACAAVPATCRAGPTRAMVAPIGHACLDLTIEV